MKDKTLLWIILGVAAVSVYISYRTASGLKSATSSAEKVNEFLKPILAKVGIK